MTGSRLGYHSYDALMRFFGVSHGGKPPRPSARDGDGNERDDGVENGDWLLADIDRDENVAISEADADRTPDGLTRTALARMFGGRKS